MSKAPLAHLVQRATNAVMAAAKAKKGESDMRKRVAAALEEHLRAAVLIGTDEAVNAIAARRREL